MSEQRQTRVCASSEQAPAAPPAKVRVAGASRRGGKQRTGRLVNIEPGGHVWVQVLDGEAPYVLRCMAMAPFHEDDLDTEVLAWEHSCGVGVVIARALEGGPRPAGHTRESFVRTVDVQQHELEEVAPVEALAITAARETRY